MVLEQLWQPANNSAVHVAVVATGTGVRVLVRAGAMAESERLRLKESISALLADAGLSGSDIVIQIAPQPGAGARKG